MTRPLPPGEVARRWERRFWAKAEKTESCWVWRGNRWPSGYGRVNRGGRQTNAHRVAWAYANGPIPAGMDVLHHCDNPPCVNPAHLYLGTDVENTRDKVARGRASKLKGEAAGRAILTDARVRELRKLRAQGWSFAELGRRFGVDKRTARLAAIGETWGHVS